ncbi:hypothetical protein NDI56_21050 [Haloarcula sp. S1CR25-12]|uniref:Uncharacterized protein n=1 Tax=Haloarcula saliterrae TaxID=2950534 RepID=A0ABU2FI08_9EURY|nr:hypothetical protein [Haloarcula sp. S1CR25-12]MDS0261897.1 hypothetical protein [Haloarcula sp. S1CR25-12]
MTDLHLWRVGYDVGGVAHYTAWTGQYDAVAALYDQYRYSVGARSVRLEWWCVAPGCDYPSSG